MPIRADKNNATVNNAIPMAHQKNTEYGSSSWSFIKSGLAVLFCLNSNSIELGQIILVAFALHTYHTAARYYCTNYDP